MLKKVLKKMKNKVEITLVGQNYERKRKYLIKQGAKIGSNTRILSDLSSFGTEPYLIEIGENCLFSANVHFLTHDGSISVLNNLNTFKSRADKLGQIKIGNNVFLGLGVTVLPNVSIGNNVIVGAGSIITKDIEDNNVVCGVPARIIMSLNDYKKKISGDIHFTADMTVAEKRLYCEQKINKSFK